LIELFWDDDAAGFFTTGRDAERLVADAKDLLDNATPAANSTAAVALLRLAALTGIEAYRDKAAAVLGLLSDVVTKHPTAVPHLLAAVELWHAGATEVAVAGDLPELVHAVQARFLPNAVLAWGEPYDSPLWEARQPGYAYVCQGFVCLAPVTTPDALIAELDR
jgi:uncharacterized protein YyaL (SSP411 family)